MVWGAASWWRLDVAGLGVGLYDGIHEDAALHLSVRLGSELADVLRAEAQQRKMPVSECVRQAIRGWLDQTKAGKEPRK